MLFAELVDAELPEEFRPIIDNLLEKKQNMPEMGLAPKIKELDDFIKKELKLAKQATDETEAMHCLWERLDSFSNEQVVRGR